MELSTRAVVCILRKRRRCVADAFSGVARRMEMWLFTPIGFFSVVQKIGEDNLTIRSRVASDLESLRKQFLPSLSTIIATPDADYAFRGTASHRDFAEALASIAMAIDY